MRNLGILLWVCSPYTVAPACAGDDAERHELISLDELKYAIQKKYPVESQPKGPPLHFDPKAKIEALDSHVLRNYLPKTRYYFTSLATDYFDSPIAPAVFSISTTRGKVSLQKCFDLRFTAPDKEFLAQFVGLQAQDIAQRKNLSLAIGELLAKPTGQLKNGRFEKSDYWMEIWFQNDIWRYIVIKFAEKGSLKNIVELNPRDVNKSDY